MKLSNVFFDIAVRRYPVMHERAKESNAGYTEITQALAV
jgi:hypothetical protein